MFAKEEEKKKTKKASKKKVSHISETELDEDFNWAFTPLLDSLSRNVSTFQAGAIPRVILQVSNTSSSFALPAKYQEARSSWVVLNPGYSVKLFSLKDMDRFVYYKCSEEERNAYNRLSVVKQRVALFKFLYLLKRGGIYAELDTECRVPVKSWSLGKRNVGLVIGFKDQHHNPPSFQQAVIAATPNHPVIAEFVKKQVSDILTRTQSDFSAHVSFHDYFYKRFNEYMTQVMKQAGINPQIELAKLSWSGYAEFDDVLVHGNERFTPNNQNNILAFVVNRGGFWDEEFLNVSVA
ncbi:hypothetical protein BCR33DRAFT_94515 [Rhizoclosmatium globosum]|uniref:Alpha 1,4-glycosyltransferase domain-containing protein n=1 Tax=Rhizoclosmatium globosum TaxID=329046 RepID=A0A1Y2CJZ4_9FUNG|nr:hypothetical protein BCR33DRAFT_94515 [Rhizoclosmatium globosum]|eukprot:ORY47341.1 hypothetical protein BCR33DRAFT_94515 [Rhizoclosmatium globosum]